MYITFNDVPSGIYYSQVTDVCRFLQRTLSVSVTLVAFISIRNFAANRKKIKATGVPSWVIPMFPKPKNWRLNRTMSALITWLINPSVIVARGPYACSLALRSRSAKRRIVFDGRGAYEAELNEYDVSGSAEMRAEIADVERNVVLNSDYRIAVSEELVKYWREKYRYNGNDHAVIPCTLSETYAGQTHEFAAKQENTITIIYAGSSAGWQTLDQLDQLLYPAMKDQPEIQLHLLTPTMPSDLRVVKEFPDRVRQNWLSPGEVRGELLKADYGWLVRERTVTNLVSSPVKFAEYLASGLKVITSASMGDNAKFVTAHNAGVIAGADGLPKLEPVSPQEKKRMAALAMAAYTKENYTAAYRKVLNL